MGDDIGLDGARIGFGVELVPSLQLGGHGYLLQSLKTGYPRFL